MEATLLAYIHPSFQRFTIVRLSLALQAFPSSSIHVPRILHRDQQHSSGGLPSVIHTHWSLQQSQHHRFIISIVKHHSTIQHSSSSIRQHFQSLFFASSFFLFQLSRVHKRVPGLGTGHGMFNVDQRDNEKYVYNHPFCFYFRAPGRKGSLRRILKLCLRNMKWMDGRSDGMEWNGLK